MPDQSTSAPRRATWGELDAAEREARLAAKLRANLARRKQQGRAREDEDAKAAPVDAAAPALDRDGGDA